MRKEDFVALGISEELSEKAANASAEELKGFVPKARYNEVAQAKSNAEASYNDVKTELDKLKVSAGDNEALQYSIKSLPHELKPQAAKYDSAITELKTTNAIRAALGSNVQDADLVAGLLDRSQMILSEDGKITGLDEQVKTLKESKPFLFKEDPGYPDVKDGGNPTNPSGKMTTRDQFADWLNQY